MPSWAATPFSTSWRDDSVGSHTIRPPSRSAVSTAAGLSPPISWSQLTPPNTLIPGTASPTIRASWAVGSVWDLRSTPS